MSVIEGPQGCGEGVTVGITNSDRVGAIVNLNCPTCVVSLSTKVRAIDKFRHCRIENSDESVVIIQVFIRIGIIRHIQIGTFTTSSEVHITILVNRHTVCSIPLVTAVHRPAEQLSSIPIYLGNESIVVPSISRLISAACGRYPSCSFTTDVRVPISINK